MKIGILQPGYIPWLGFFEQCSRVDIFVLYDDVKYTKNDWRNRNRIKSQMSEAQYLTVPVNKKSTNLTINEVLINYNSDWIKKHKTLIKQYYQKADYYQNYADEIFKILDNEFQYLCDLDIELVKYINKWLDLDIKLKRSSDMKLIEQDKNQRLLEICKKENATYFYDGKSAGSFLDFNLFRNEGIEVELQNYNHPVYRQLWGDFVPYLSIIDLLLNEGENSLSILTNQGKK